MKCLEPVEGRFIRCEDLALESSIRVPGMHPGDPSAQSAWIQSSRSGAAWPLVIMIDLKTRMVRIAFEDDAGSGDKWGEFYTPLTNVKDFRVWRGKAKEKVTAPAKEDK